MDPVSQQQGTLTVIIGRESRRFLFRRLEKWTRADAGPDQAKLRLGEQLQQVGPRRQQT
jgi:hypothetical protein